MLYEIIGSETVQGSDVSGSEDYELIVRDERGVLTDINGVVDDVTWTVVEDDGTDLTANVGVQSRVSTGRYTVNITWAAPVVKPFSWRVTAAFTYNSASIEFEILTNFLPVAEANLVLVDGADNYTRSWKETFAECWAALRGPTAGTELVQTHEHADGTSAFTVTVSVDGDRTYS